MAPVCRRLDLPFRASAAIKGASEILTTMEVSSARARAAIPMGKEPGGFNFDLSARNASLIAEMGKNGQRMPQPMSTGCVAPLRRARACVDPRAAASIQNHDRRCRLQGWHRARCRHARTGGSEVADRMREG